MGGSRFEELVRVFAILVPAASASCGPDVGDGLDTSVFDRTLCEGPRVDVLPDVRLVEPVDWLAMRHAAICESLPQAEGVETVATVGEECIGATDFDRCLAAIEALPVSSEMTTPGDFDCYQHFTLAHTRGDEVGAVATREGLRAFVGPVDTPADAALFVLSEFHTLVCDGRDGVAETEDGWLLLTHTRGAECGNGVEENITAVSRDGEVEIEDSRIVKHDQTCYGRLPAGLRGHASPVGGNEVGRFFAAAAELEAAAITAFDQLACELALHDAPRELVAAACRARRDEVRHARITALLARRYGGRPSYPRVRPWTPRSLVDVAADNLREGCIRETYGALVAWVQARRARDPVVRRALSAIAVDETRHAALSWQLARWADRRLRSNERRRVATSGREALHRRRDQHARATTDASDPTSRVSIT